MSDWKSKIKNKKNPFIISVNNLTSSTLVLKSEKLSNGKYHKKAKAIDKVKPYETEEMGLLDNPVGEWIWVLQDDPSHHFKMYISGKESKVVYEDLHPSASWIAEVQQEWDIPIPQIVLIANKNDRSSTTTTPRTDNFTLGELNG